MTGRIPDDDLRAMLDDRASRVSPNAAREAMAGARGVIRGPAAGRAGFAVLPVALRDRGASVPAGLAAAGIVAVLVLAVVGGRIDGDRASRDRGTTGVPEATAPVVPASTAPVVPLGEVIPRSSLKARLEAGDLAGFVLVVEGRLVAADGLCRIGASAPCHAEVDGVPGVQVWPSRPFDSTPAWSAVVFDEASRPMAMRVGPDGSLTYLGTVAWPTDRPATIGDLRSTDPSVSGMAVVDGWLAPSRIAARSPCPRLAACVPTSEWLSGLDPSADGGPGRPVRANEVEVSISIDADVSVDADTLLPSWFLVRPTGSMPEWEVVGRVAGVVPQVPASGPASSASTAPPALGGPTLTADELRAAIADGSLDGRVIVVDGRLDSMQIPCPAPGACNVLVLHGLDGILVTDDRRPAGAEPPPDRGRLLLVPGGGGLRLLGAAPASLGHPLTVKELATGISLAARAVPLDAVSGWIVSRGPVYCPYETEGATPCTASWPWLTDDEPGPGRSPTSDIGVPVRVAEPLAGGPLATPVARGPFLVRRLLDWEVVAVLGTGPVPHATLP